MRHRRQIAFTDSELARLKSEADKAGLPDAKYMRQVMLAAWSLAELPKARRANPRLEWVQEMCQLNFQLRKYGANLNQLAKQANQGMVPLSRPEIQYMLNALQTLFSKAAKVLERELR